MPAGSPLTSHLGTWESDSTGLISILCQQRRAWLRQDNETSWRPQIWIQHRLPYFCIILNTFQSCCGLTLWSSNKSFQGIWKIGFTAPFCFQGSMDQHWSVSRRSSPWKTACYNTIQDEKGSLSWYGSHQGSFGLHLVCESIQSCPA